MGNVCMTLSEEEQDLILFQRNREVVKAMLLGKVVQCRAIPDEEDEAAFCAWCDYTEDHRRRGVTPLLARDGKSLFSDVEWRVKPLSMPDGYAIVNSNGQFWWVYDRPGQYVISPFPCGTYNDAVQSLQNHLNELQKGAKV